MSPPKCGWFSNGSTDTDPSIGRDRFSGHGKTAVSTIFLHFERLTIDDKTRQHLYVIPEKKS